MQRLFTTFLAVTITASCYSQRAVTRYNSSGKFKLAIQNGLSYLTEKGYDYGIAEFTDYAKNLNTGYHIGADFSYFFARQYGAGAKVNLYKSTNRLSDYFIYDTLGNSHEVVLQEAISFLFVGPTASMRFFNKRKRNVFYFNLGLGYLLYKNKGGTTSSDKNTLIGGTFGQAVDIGYDFGISKNFAIGFQSSFVGGILKEYKIKSRDRTPVVELIGKDTKDLRRIDISIGLRYSF